MVRPKPLWIPPARDGVGASRVGVGASHFKSVLHFLTERFPAVDNWPDRLSRGNVLDAVGQPLKADSPCSLGMALWYWREPPPEHPMPFPMRLLFQDELLVVVDKPHFLAVTPGGRHLHETALVRIKRQTGIDTLSPMHRLDLETAGVLVFTVQPYTRHAYHALLRDRQVHKVYEAIAPWRADLQLPQTCLNRLEEKPGAGFMQMDVVAGESNAQTQVELLRRMEPAPGLDHLGPLAHYRLIPLTGRKHQLRVHMNGLGLPIVFDRIYPRLLPEPPLGQAPDYSQPLQLLARSLSFTDPVSGQQRSFSSQLELQCAGGVSDSQPLGLR